MQNKKGTKEMKKLNPISRLRLQGRKKVYSTILAAIVGVGPVVALMDTGTKTSGTLEDLACTTSVENVSETAASTASTTTAVTVTSACTSSKKVTHSTTTSTSTSSSTTTTSTTSSTSSSTTTTTTTTTTAATTLTSTTTQTTATATNNDWNLPITQTEYMYLANLVGHEYGSYWVPTAERAKVVAVVMNRVRDPRFPNTIYGVLTAPYQFTGWSSYGAYGYTAAVKQVPDCMAAVDYYFAHQSEFPNWLYFDGCHYAADGSGPYNYFRF